LHTVAAKAGVATVRRAAKETKETAMLIHSTRARMLAGCLTAATAAATLASCAPGYREPETVQASNPSVTYRYRGDQELLRANQQAAAFCNQYGTMPRTVNLTNNPDGTNTVIFDCLTYTYRTDRELLDASRRADAYCMNYGQRMISTSSIVTNADGSRTAMFQCGPSIATVP
jgi:hypothetical protein